MNPLLVWLRNQGLCGIPREQWIATAIAGSLVLLAVIAGMLAQRLVGQPLSRAWKGRLPGQAEGLGARVPGIVRHGTAALILAVLINIDNWPPIAAAPIGLGLGAATAMAALTILRGLGIARWMAWLVAVALFTALFSHAVGGLQPITATLERIGFDVGRRRFSMLSLLTILITVIALYALVRLANRVVAHWIAQSRGLDATQKLLSQKLAAIAVVVVAFFVGVDVLDIDLTTFAVFSGALGLAIGFGLQMTVGK